jgi:hypothetical protein
MSRQKTNVGAIPCGCPKHPWVAPDFTSAHNGQAQGPPLPLHRLKKLCIRFKIFKLAKQEL